jgi:hypothetical protein
MERLDGREKGELERATDVGLKTIGGSQQLLRSVCNLVNPLVALITIIAYRKSKEGVEVNIDAVLLSHRKGELQLSNGVTSSRAV